MKKIHVNVMYFQDFNNPEIQKKIKQLSINFIYTTQGNYRTFKRIVKSGKKLCKVNIYVKYSS